MMSITLLVCARVSRSPAFKKDETLEKVIRQAREAARTLRFVSRSQDDGLCLEPFLASAAFAALLQNPRKRPTVVEAVRVIVLELFRYYRRVDLELRDETRSLAEPPVRQLSLNEALLSLADVKPVRLLVRSPLLQFHIHSVEARLFHPLLVDSGAQATSYFQHFDVVASDESEVRQLLTAELAGDGATFLGWQSIDVETVGDPGPPRMVKKSGRVFFNDG